MNSKTDISAYFMKPSCRYEYLMHNFIYNATMDCRDLIHVPMPYSFDEDTQTIRMQNIPKMNISDYYGEEWENVPKHIQRKIKLIVKQLFLKGYVFPDITGYNFIEFEDKIWIIDFEHTFVYNGMFNELSKTQKLHYKFVEKFIEDDDCGWNPFFK